MLHSENFCALTVVITTIQTCSLLLLAATFKLGGDVKTSDNKRLESPDNFRAILEEIISGFIKFDHKIFILSNFTTAH